jgi:oligoendopeptidase F
MTTNRSQVEKKDTWDLEALFSTSKEWEKEFEKIVASVGEIAKYKGRLGHRDDLLSCLSRLYEIDRIIEKLNSYTSCRLNEDLGNGPSNERDGKLSNFLSDFGAMVAFIDPELASCNEEYLTTLLSDPDFTDYRMHIDGIIREKAHLLSEKEEALLATVMNSFGAPDRIYSKAQNVDMVFKSVHCDGEKKELTDATYRTFLEHPDGKVRQRAMNNMMGAYAASRNMFTETLGAHVKTQVDLAKARNYDHVMGSFLHGENIPASVYQTLFGVTNENLHLLHRYCDIRKKAMGLRKLHWYDLYVPIISGIDGEYTYGNGVGLIGKALSPLGAEYVETLLAGLTTKRWVDKYENKGKMSGAYSGGSYDGFPYILLNFNGKLEYVFTIAHEGGHSMHTELARRTQTYPLYDYNIFLAEIASTMNENLLSDHLLKGADKNMRAFILNKKLESIRTTFFRQTMFAEFEAMLYDVVWNGKTLTPDFLEKEYHALNERYYGPGVVVDDLIRHEWSRIPHFFYNFYVYQYATGIAAATYFSKKVLEGGEAERENYFNVLRAGGSDYAIPILQKAGLDVTSPEYLKAIMDEFKDTLDEFEELIG